MPKLIDADEFKRVAAGCVFETPKGIRIKAEIAIDARPAVDAEPVRRGKGCEFCKGRSYTKKPLTVITRTMKRAEVCFNFCPNCGRDMRATDTDVGGKGGDDND